jgi:hypothetical protein
VDEHMFDKLQQAANELENENILIRFLTFKLIDVTRLALVEDIGFTCDSSTELQTFSFTELSLLCIMLSSVVSVDCAI